MNQTTPPTVGFERVQIEGDDSTWELDKLNRKNSAHQLERLIACTKGPYVIAMTSDWGSGKTFFLKSWEKELNTRRKPCVYFNAWEMDHAGDPLISLTGCIISQMQKKEYISSTATSDLERKVTNIVKKSPQLFAKLLFSAGNILTNGMLSSVKEEIINSLDFGTNLFFENEQSREQFKVELGVIARVVTEEQDGNIDPINGRCTFPLLIMIDELDRCQPNYAIELLESIKHLFNVPGVVFLLAIDGHQILTIIEHTFGLKKQETEDKRQDYLRKFIDIFWPLPEPDARAFVLQKLLEKQTPIPENWPNPSENGFRDLYDIPQDDPILSQNSYYYALSCAVVGTNKKLRDYLQILEKFYVLSSCYKMNTRDCFVIFNMLINKTNELSFQEMNNVIKQEDFIPNYRIVTHTNVQDDFYLTLHTAIINNSYHHTLYDVDESGALRNPDRLLKYYFSRIFTRFSGRELTNSVTQKIAFLDEFHFGE